MGLFSRFINKILNGIRIFESNTDKKHPLASVYEVSILKNDTGGERYPLTLDLGQHSEELFKESEERAYHNLRRRTLVRSHSGRRSAQALHR